MFHRPGEEGGDRAYFNQINRLAGYQIDQFQAATPPRQPPETSKHFSNRCTGGYRRAKARRNLDLDRPADAETGCLKFTSDWY